MAARRRGCPFWTQCTTNNTRLFVRLLSIFLQWATMRMFFTLLEFNCIRFPPRNYQPRATSHQPASRMPPACMHMHTPGSLALSSFMLPLCWRIACSRSSQLTTHNYKKGKKGQKNKREKSRQKSKATKKLLLNFTPCGWWKQTAQITPK